MVLMDWSNASLRGRLFRVMFADFHSKALTHIPVSCSIRYTLRLGAIS